LLLRPPDAEPNVTILSNLTRTLANVSVLLDAKLTRPRTEILALAKISHAKLHAPQEKVVPPLLPTLPSPPSQVASAPLLMEKIHVMLFMEVSGPLWPTELPAQLEVTPVVTPEKEKVAKEVKEKALVLPNSSPAPWSSPPLF
jgi:hypothetical protein